MMNGSYKFILDGEVVAESKNIITNTGKDTIKRFLAGTIADWAGGMAVGTVSTAASATDAKLGFEVDRQPTLLRTVDSSGNIILKASFPTDLQMTVKEIGIFPFSDSTASGQYQDDIITDFSESTWSGGQGTTNVLVGSKTLTLNSSTVYELTGLSIDISGYSAADQFELLVNATTVNTITLTINDVDTYTFTTGTSGTQVLTKTITPRTQDTITSIKIARTAGTGTVYVDALKFLNADETNYISGIVSRSIPTSFTKAAGQTLEVEYSLAVT